MLLGINVGIEPDEEHPIAKTTVPMTKTHFAKNKFIFPAKIQRILTSIIRLHMIGLTRESDAM